MTKTAGTFPFAGHLVNRMGYGAMQLAGPGVFGPPKDRVEAVAVLREAVASGVNHIDTSDYYGPFVTNEIICDALHPYPQGLVIVTKVGGRRGDDASWLPANSPAELESAVEDNLRRLRLDALDVVNLRIMGRTLEPGEGPVEKEVTVLADLRRRGLIRHVGISNATPAQVAEAQTIVPIACVQNHYNLIHRGDDALIDSLEEQGIAYVPFFPLGGFTPIQSSALSRIAAGLGATAMQVALAWLLQRAPNILLIPGTASRTHLRENLKAAELVLPQSELAKLDAITAAT